MREVAALVGRGMVGLLFLIFGAMGAVNISATAAYFSKLGFPHPQLMAYLAVLIEVLSGLALIVGWKTRWFASLLMLYLLIATAAAHRFWEYRGADGAAQMQHFFKNLAIIGGLLYIALWGAGRASMDKR